MFLLAFLCLAGQTAAHASPILDDFAPTSGMTGSQVLLVGSGFMDADAVSFNGTTATFVVISDEYIIADVPSGATSGTITVTSPEGTASGSSFTVLSSLTITSFAPSQGTVSTVVTITGTHLSNATSVSFSGVAATIISNTDTQITTAVPAGATTGAISVTTPLGTVSGATPFTVIPALTVTSFAPTSGQPGQSVAIIGTGFAGVTGVTFNGTTATFDILSNTYLLATVPVGATTGLLVVSSVSAAANAGTFTVIPPLPTITSFTPTTGTEGTMVVITGTGFTYLTAVAFNGMSAAFTINSDTQITAVVPVGATDGSISVTSPGGTATSAGTFVLSAPTVATAAAATPSPVTGTKTALSVLGAYAGGESHLTYAWAKTSGPAAITFSANGTNTAKQTNATFTQAGTYGVTATITSPSGKTVTSSVSIVVAQTPTTVTLAPSAQMLNVGGAQAFTASVADQFGTAISGAVFTWSSTGTGSVDANGNYAAGGTPGMATITATTGGVMGAAQATVSDVAPTLSAITASPSPVTGTTAMLTVTGTYPGGGALTYAWSTSSAPSGGSATFSGGTTAMAGTAVTTTATFTKAGSYTVKVTVTDANNGTVSQTLPLTVLQTGTAIVVTPSSTSVAVSGTQQFAAVENDQFGNAMASQPMFTWSLASGGGSVSAAGLYTAPGTTGSAVVSAAPSDGVAAGTAGVTVTNTPPTVAQAAAANGVSGTTTITATSATLTVLGASPAGESGLTYTWTATHGVGVTFTDNADNTAKNVTALFTSAGSRTLTVTITDPTGAQVTSSVTVIVSQALTTITVTPGSDTVPIGANTVLFTAVTTDQFGNPMGTPPSLTWSNTGVGSINAGGSYSIGLTPGSATVTATSGGVSGSATVTVTDVAPTLSSIKVTPASIMGTSGTLSVTGSYTGMGNLTYAWAATATPVGGAVTFSGGTTGTSGSAVTTTATFSQPGSYTVQVTATDPSGMTAIKTVTFMVIASPTISSFSPAGGPVGTSVTITGTNFTGATVVNFNGMAAAAFTVVSSTQITATVPQGATPGVISVTTPGGTATTAINFTVFPAPSISSFTPTAGPMGTSVAITGTNLTGAISVTFNGTPATFTVNSSNSITAIVPAGSTTGAITVTALGGTVTSASNFLVTPSPIINSFGPQSGPVGTTVTINGSNFTDVSLVTFGAASTSAFTVNSSASITVTVPAGASTSAISVTAAAGTATSQGVFTVIPIPTINGFSPSSGAIGASVTITGANFIGTSSVTFGSIPATAFTVVSATQISATVPAGAASGFISVTTPGGIANSLATFTVIPAPVVTALSPMSGPAGTSVTIMGANLTGATSVAFNGTLATSYTVASATQITATVPVGATTGTVTVTTPGGTASTVGVFTVIPTPVITIFSPSSGPIGALVTISGSGLTGATAVTFNGVAAVTFTVNSSTSLMVIVPAGAISGVLTITTPGGTAISSTNFTVLPPPTITSFSPTSGLVGTSVTITGANFTNATEVTFGGTDASSYIIVSPSKITATVPMGAATGVIGVTTPNGSATSSGNFTVVPTPVISSFSPASGVFGSTVTITGSGLTNASAITFNGAPAVTYTVISDSSISAVVPMGATTGPISVTAPGGTVVSATNYTIFSRPAIVGFSPSSGPVNTPVTITGMGLTGTTSVTFNGSAASFTVVSDGEIMATVPPGATTGVIAVTNPAGTAMASTPFTVIPSPTITSFSPSSGVVGTAVTITGTNLTGATVVSFGGAASITFTVNTSTSITAVVPAGAATGVITVATPGGTATSETSFTVLTQPVITSVNPSMGIVGASVTISGTGFYGATTVKFAGVLAAVVTETATQITTTVPPGASTGVVTVTTPIGTATSATAFSVIPTPVISGFSPPSGPVGATVTIAGTGLTGASIVTFGGIAATFTVVSDTFMTAVVPTGAVTGTVTVTTPGGTATSASAFTIIPAPSITGFSPVSGPVSASVTITGTSLTGATSVTFNGISAPVTTDTATQITTTVPAGAATGVITVTTPGGTATSAASFTVVPAPTISSFSPMSGPAGTSVTITGTALTGATSVKFNGTYATFTVISATSMTATVPMGATPGVITVTTPGGTAMSVNTFTVIPSPMISGFSPVSGPVGISVTITGTGLTGATAVTFGGVSAVTFTSVSSTSVTATVPTGALTGVVMVTTPGGTATSAGSFTVIPVPTISGFSPPSGPVGTAVTIIGTGLTGATSVTFGGVSAASFTVNSAASITATVPAGSATGAITVTTPGGTATSASAFTVIPAPAISNFAPTSGPVGTSVTIKGTAFTGATSVTFGGVSATSITVTSATSITATVPVGATTGVITVTTPGGTATSVGSFTVIPTPAIISFSPMSGLVGTSVTIIGTGLTGATSVKFNGTMATYTVISATSITATVPASAMTGVITVTTPGGTATSAGSFTVLTAPTITGVSPGSGIVGTSVTITGAGLSGATSVKFNGTTATFTVISATSITVTVPSGATTGVITVTTAGGTATSAASFTVLTWNAVDVAADPDGTAKVLAVRTDNAASVWLFSASDALTTSGPVFGPYVTGQGTWTAKAIKTAPDGTSQILWTRSDDAMGLWSLNPDGTVGVVGPTYGPYSDSHGSWSATGLAMASDGTARVLWTRSDGGASEWDFSASGMETNEGPIYGPYGSGQSAWRATGLAGGSQGTSHLLWTRADGAAGLWTMSATDAETTVGPTYGPYATPQGLWQATAAAASVDGISHVLWVRSDGAAGLWTFSPADMQTDAGPVDGPFGGFAARAVDTFDDQSRVLWIRSDRGAGLWTFNPDDTEILSGPVYGPF